MIQTYMKRMELTGLGSGANLAWSTLADSLKACHILLEIFDKGF